MDNIYLNNAEIYVKFDVVGAGKIQISKKANCCCGHRAGFSFGVSWGSNAYCGGVLSREEARNLAEHILNTLADCTDTEEECYNKALKTELESDLI